MPGQLDMPDKPNLPEKYIPDARDSFSEALGKIHTKFNYVDRNDITQWRELHRYNKELRAVKKFYKTLSMRKKILYQCRKNFADERPREGGRFIPNPKKNEKVFKHVKRGRPRKFAIPELPDEQLYNQDWFGNSQMFPSAPLPATSSLLNSNGIELHYVDFLSGFPPKDRNHDENSSILECEPSLDFDPIIDMPCSLQLDPPNWGENAGSVEQVSDSTSVIKYADAIGRFGAIPRPSRHKDKTVAEVGNSISNVIYVFK